MCAARSAGTCEGPEATVGFRLYAVSGAMVTRQVLNTEVIRKMSRDELEDVCSSLRIPTGHGPSDDELRDAVIQALSAADDVNHDRIRQWYRENLTLDSVLVPASNFLNADGTPNPGRPNHLFHVHHDRDSLAGEHCSLAEALVSNSPYVGSQIVQNGTIMASGMPYRNGARWILTEAGVRSARGLPQI